MIDVGSGNYSLQVAAKCLSFYEEFFNESYKLSKMDSVAVPDFSGAMENYGLNIYGTSYLIYLPTDQSEADRTLITLIIGIIKNLCRFDSSSLNSFIQHFDIIYFLNCLIIKLCFYYFSST